MLFVCFPTQGVGEPLVSCESCCKTSRWAVKVHGIVLLLIDCLMVTDQETEHCFPLSAIPASPRLSSLTPWEGVSPTRPPFDCWISLSVCLTSAQRQERGDRSSGGGGGRFGEASLHSVEVLTRRSLFSFLSFIARQQRQLATHPSRGGRQKAKVARPPLLHSHNPPMAAG